MFALLAFILFFNNSPQDSKVKNITILINRTHLQWIHTEAINFLVVFLHSGPGAGPHYTNKNSRQLLLPDKK